MATGDPLPTQGDVNAGLPAELMAASFDGSRGDRPRRVRRGVPLRSAHPGPHGGGQGADRRSRARQPRAVRARTGRDGQAVRAPAHRQHLPGRHHPQRAALHRDAVPPARFAGGQDPGQRADRVGRRAAHRGQGRRRIGDRAPPRDPASRRQTGEHPAHRIRRATADRFRDRTDHRRLRNRGRRGHGFARVHRPRGAARPVPRRLLRHLQPGVDAVLCGHRPCGVRAPQGRADGGPVPPDHQAPDAESARVRSARRRVRGDRAGHVPQHRRPARDRGGLRGAAARCAAAARLAGRRDAHSDRGADDPVQPDAVGGHAIIDQLSRRAR